MLREVHESTDMLAEDVGQVKDTAAIGKRVACIRFVHKCDCKEVSVRKSTVAQTVKFQMINNERSTGHRPPE